MQRLKTLIEKVEKARQQFIKTVDGLTFEQTTFKSTPDSWSIVENVEHIVWAERAGVYKMWMAVDEYKNNPIVWSTPPIHHGLSIENIIAKTWQPKEKVPEIAKPRWGGPLNFWIASLKASQPLLEELGKALIDLNLEQIIYPHPISGPMNMIQRLAFLRFHLERHQYQMENIKKHRDFPK